MKFIYATFTLLLFVCHGFVSRTPISSKFHRLKMSPTPNDLFSQIQSNSNSFADIFQQSVLLLADTSVSEEDVINVVGQSNELPDPLIFVGTAVAIFLGVAILQFSLGDLTKEVSNRHTFPLLKFLWGELLYRNANVFAVNAGRASPSSWLFKH